MPPNSRAKPRSASAPHSVGTWDRNKRGQRLSEGRWGQLWARKSPQRGQSQERARLRSGACLGRACAPPARSLHGARFLTWEDPMPPPLPLQGLVSPCVNLCFSLHFDLKRAHSPKKKKKKNGGGKGYFLLEVKENIQMLLLWGNVPGGPVINTLSLHFWGYGFNPWSGN